MKKGFVLLFSLFSIVSFSQMTLSKLDGTPINDNDILNYNIANETEGYLGIKVYNSSSNGINVKAKCVSMTNTTGTNVQFCIDPICVANLVVGNSYPSATLSLLVPANGQNGNYDHFFNSNTGIVQGVNVDYVFKFYQVDDSDVEIGNSVTFTYRYNPNLSTPNMDLLTNSGIRVDATNVSSTLQFSSQKSVTLEILDLNGKKISSYSLAKGNQAVDVSKLSNGIYIMSFTTVDGEKLTQKFMKK
jgi:hypothetical protein